MQIELTKPISKCKNGGTPSIVEPFAALLLAKKNWEKITQNPPEVIDVIRKFRKAHKIDK